MRKTFCKTCGVNMSNEFTQVSDPAVAAQLPDMIPINLRVFDDFSTDGLKITHMPDDTRDPPYINP